MASTIPYTAIKDFLQSEFSGVYPVLDFDQIEDQQEQGGDPDVAGDESFLALEEIIGDEEPIGFGDPANICMRETGTIAVHCFAPAPQASATCRTIGDAVRDALRLRYLSGVRIQRVSPPDPGAMMNEGLWGMASVIVFYEWDQHVAAPS